MAENEIGSSTNEQMHMIWHDYIPTNGNIKVVRSALGEEDEGGMNFITSEKSYPAMRAECDEVERARTEKPVQTKRPSPEVFVHPRDL